MGQTMCGVMAEESPKAISNMEQVSDLDFNRNSTYKKLEQYSLTVCKDSQISTVYNYLIQRLLSMSQFHLLEKLKEFTTPNEKNAYLQQMQVILNEIDVIDSLFHHFNIPTNKNSAESNQAETYLDIDHIEKLPYVINVQDFSFEQYQRQYIAGLNSIAEKQGGKNVRFGVSPQSKGVSDLDLPSEMCLFDIIGRKLQTLKDIAFSGIQDETKKASFQIVIITNSQNYYAIKRIWMLNSFFGFEESDVLFIAQGMYPITDNSGKILLKEDSSIHLFPCGTGDAILKLYHHKIIDSLLEKKYKYLHFIGVDNLLVKPLDPLLIGIALEQNKAIAQKCVSIDQDDDDFYRLLYINGRASIFDSSEIEAIIKNQLDKNKQRSRLDCSTVVPESSSLNQDIMNAPAFMTNTLVSVGFLHWFRRQSSLKFAFDSKFRVTKRYLSDVQPIRFHSTQAETNQTTLADQLQQLDKLQMDLHLDGNTPFPTDQQQQQNQREQPQVDIMMQTPIGGIIDAKNDQTQQQMQQQQHPNNLSLSTEPNVFIFEKNLGDLLEQTEDVCFVKVLADEEFAPIIRKTGHNSGVDAFTKMSHLHKRWLRFDEMEFDQSRIVEVCPSVSYAGENLEQAIEYFKQLPDQLESPLLLNQELVTKINKYFESKPQPMITATVHDEHSTTTDNLKYYGVSNDEQQQHHNMQYRKNSELVSKSYSNIQEKPTTTGFQQQSQQVLVSKSQDTQHLKSVLANRKASEQFDSSFLSIDEYQYNSKNKNYPPGVGVGISPNSKHNNHILFSNQSINQRKFTNE